MQQSLHARRRITLEHIERFADGVAVRTVGAETFRLCERYVDEIVLVDTDEICGAIQDIFEENRTVVEPAGALSVAGIKKYVRHQDWRNRTLVGINCGANMNFDRLRQVAERADRHRRSTQQGLVRQQ
jgi:threonine dehydratase